MVFLVNVVSKIEGTGISRISSESLRHNFALRTRQLKEKDLKERSIRPEEVSITLNSKLDLKNRRIGKPGRDSAPALSLSCSEDSVLNWCV